MLLLFSLSLSCRLQAVTQTPRGSAACTQTLSPLLTELMLLLLLSNALACRLLAVTQMPHGSAACTPTLT
jgi:hypothetical protein